MKLKKNSKDAVVMIPLKDIQPHPEETDIYGPVDTDNDFIASIRDQGILQPIIIADSKLLDKEKRERKYFTVAGHRRHLGSFAAGLNSIPAMIREYKSYDETVLHLLATNLNREKTEAQRRREFLRGKQILSQFGKLRMAQGIYTDTSFENEELFRYLEKHKVDETKPLNSVEVLKEMTGYSKYEQELTTVVYEDEYQEKQLKKLRKMKLPVEAENELCKKWDEARQLVDDDKATLKEAYDAIRKMLDDLIKKLNPVKKKTKTKPQTPSPKSQDDIEALIEKLFEPFGEPKKFIDYAEDSKHAGYMVGYTYNRNAGQVPVGMWIGKKKPEHKLDFNVLARIYEKMTGSK